MFGFNEHHRKASKRLFPPSLPQGLERTAETTFLSINRFERKKNLGLALRAFADLKARRAAEAGKMRLVVAGGYDPRDGRTDGMG